MEVGSRAAIGAERDWNRKPPFPQIQEKSRELLGFLKRSFRFVGCAALYLFLWRLVGKVVISRSGLMDASHE